MGCFHFKIIVIRRGIENGFACRIQQVKGIVKGVSGLVKNNEYFNFKLAILATVDSVAIEQPLHVHAFQLSTSKVGRIRQARSIIDIIHNVEDGIRSRQVGAGVYRAIGEFRTGCSGKENFGIVLHRGSIVYIIVFIGWVARVGVFLKDGILKDVIETKPMTYFVQQD